MSSTRFANVVVSAYAEAEPWKEDHDTAMTGFCIEEMVSWGNRLFRGLSEDEETWHTQVFESKVAYDAEWQENLLELFRKWLKGSERLLTQIEWLEGSGFEVRGSGEFRQNCIEARGILTDDDKFFVGEALINLRDEAIDEHRRGGTRACQDGGARNVRTGEYHRLLELLPQSARQNAQAAFRMFLANPDHPALRRHLLADTHRGRHRSGSWSVSINLRYRALYVVDDDTNVWYWIGSHADYDSLTGRKA